ncbi:hypothetical protein SEA_DOGFISH_50 [Gordonia phage Dogfish]|nr:hypothetical protein SEA_DOGFISH_50 [Gordonia phage Dogfish]
MRPMNTTHEQTLVDAEDRARRRIAAKLRDVRRDLSYLADVWPYLVALQVPGTRKRWAQNDIRHRGVALTANQLEAMGWKGVPRPAAADVNVLTVIADIERVTSRIALELLHTLPPYNSRVFRPDHSPARDPRPWLRLIDQRLDQAHAKTIDDPDPIVIWAERILGQTPADAARMIGDVRSGQDLAGICPWCDGLTPAGTGEATMRIHYPDEMDLTKPLDPDAPMSAADRNRPGPLIVCHGVNCTPPEHDCGTRWHGHPAWNMREWEWLAKRLRTPEGATA